MIDLFLRCTPPKVTAQQKRVDTRGRKPRFYHGDRMKRESATWAALLAPHAPAAPLLGPLTLSMRLVYPPLAKTRVCDRDRLTPKVTKPDCSNVGKHLEDLFARLGFIEDDAQFVRTTVEKFHGPRGLVGIRIQMAAFIAEEA